MNNNISISVKNISKHFKEIVAVDNLSFTVNKGDIYGFLGPNGAGKSTTIRMLSSLIQPDKGDIQIFQKSIKNFRIEILKKIGILIEKPDFYPYLSAFKNLQILATYADFKITDKQISETLELVGLFKRQHSKVKTFSQGMKQRLGLAQAILHDPELLILDEPGNGLDPQGTKDIRELILHLNKTKNKTIFLSSHLLSEVEQVANRMLIINKGQKIVEGDVVELLDEEIINVMFTIDKIEEAKKIITKTQFEKYLIETDKDELKFSISKNDIAQINKLLIDNGLKISAIKPIRALEEYFLKITENSN